MAGWERTCLPMQETQGTRFQSLGWEGSLEEKMATHSSILASRIPWTEEPGGIQSVGSQRIRHDWAGAQNEKRNERAVDSFPGTSPTPYGNCPGIASHPRLPVLQPVVTLKIFIWRRQKSSVISDEMTAGTASTPRTTQSMEFSRPEY